jgi:dTDP-4-amino-4,6-dideoxygalactose transaminase
MEIPFLDLKAPHQELEEELVEVFQECLRNASFVGGPQVQAFEEEFAQFCETKYCVAVSSGTDALRFALIAAGIGPGDEVITVPNTFIATTEAISQTGATPAFVDIDEQTYNMDPNKLEDYLKGRCKVGGSRLEASHVNPKSVNPKNQFNLQPQTSNLHPRPAAVLPVHLYGQPANMDSILEIANRYGLIVIEDACQAHGALYYSEKDKKWKKAGSMGLAAAFSFYPGKNLGACGEGGAVTTNNEDIAQKIRMLRDHGQAKKYYHEFEGYNGRLDAIQAGILRVKLKHLSEWNEKRRRNALLYTQLLTRNTELGTRNPVPVTLNTIITPYEPAWSKAVYHLYIIRIKKRDELQRYLSENGINTGLHYPIPLHFQNAYQRAGLTNGSYPITEKVAQEILSLPMFSNLTVEQIEYVSSKIKEFYQL